MPLNPERQAAIQAIDDVESGASERWFSLYPYASAFFRRLTGCGKVSGKALRAVTGIIWDPRERLATLSDYEMAFDTLIRTRGQYCPTPLCSSIRHWLFPEVEFQQMERARQRASLSGHKYSVKRVASGNGSASRQQYSITVLCSWPSLTLTSRVLTHSVSGISGIRSWKRLNGWACSGTGRLAFLPCGSWTGCATATIA
ncbi:TPA: plasmid SOS inhibition protein A [Enterobacter cloacae]|nr:plasmid SOS inhibition protein A [Enterobacter cloacae]HAS1119647.1 plasmid SOS inhibition protein A [Enterobacter cloacae]HAS1133068.1 plasmid SOS inhibition protein A [Enterobacter cloacae]